MSTLSDLLAAHTGLSAEQGGHLQRLVGEWQLLADLSFADLLLSVPEATLPESSVPESPPGFLTVAQCRPNTAATVLPVDEVAHEVDEDSAGVLRSAMARPAILIDSGTTHAGESIRRDLTPVRYDGEVIAVLTRAVADAAHRVPSPLERAYHASADDLYQMVADGTFPPDEGTEAGLSTPRAGDGFVRIDANGLVRYASPNALSAFHRMGFNSDLTGERLAEVLADLVTDAFGAQDAAGMIRLAASGPAVDPGAELPVLRMEVDSRRATVLVRAVPLRPRGVATGAIVLIRDVTEVKRRDRALISKDATIREIHHRVKNNLQSVSALLRLQARRTVNPEARTALTEAVRRVASIALVHEFLSGSVDEEVDVDEVVRRLLPVLVDATSASAGHVRVDVDGHAVEGVALGEDGVGDDGGVGLGAQDGLHGGDDARLLDELGVDLVDLGDGEDGGLLDVGVVVDEGVLEGRDEVLVEVADAEAALAAAITAAPAGRAAAPRPAPAGRALRRRVQAAAWGRSLVRPRRKRAL